MHNCQQSVLKKALKYMNKNMVWQILEDVSEELAISPLTLKMEAAGCSETSTTTRLEIPEGNYIQPSFCRQLCGMIFVWVASLKINYLYQEFQVACFQLRNIECATSSRQNMFLRKQISLLTDMQLQRLTVNGKTTKTSHDKAPEKYLVRFILLLFVMTIQIA